MGAKTQAIAEETLESSIEPFIGPRALQRLTKQKTDSNIVDEAKSISKIVLEDSLENYGNVPDFTLDSTSIDQIKVRTEVRAKTALNKEEIVIPDITIDSTLNDQIKAEAKSRASSALEGKVGADIPEITTDSITTTQLKKEVVGRAENAVKGREEFKSMEGLKKSFEIDKLKGQRDKLEQKHTELAAKQEIKEKLTSHARQYVAKHAGKIQEVQSKIGKLN